MVGDYNGDGKDDFIAIRNDGVYITYSQGRGNTFSAETKIEDKFGPNQNWANQETSPRWVGDVDGDGIYLYPFNLISIYLCLFLTI